METPINEERLQQVINAIAEETHAGFEMDYWFTRDDYVEHPCGTAACFAGHAALCAGGEIGWGITDSDLCSYVLMDGTHEHAENVALHWLEVKKPLRRKIKEIVSSTHYSKEQVFLDLQELADKFDLNVTIPSSTPQ